MIDLCIRLRDDDGMNNQLAQTVYSDDVGSKNWPAVSDPPPPDRTAAAALLQVMRSEPIGQWSTNKWQQAQHYRGVIYLAIRAIRNMATGASYIPMQRRKKSTNKTTFGKSVSATQSAGQDEDYQPITDEDHPLCKLVSHPNPHETLPELSGKLVLQNRLTGVGPVWAVPNKSRRPVELWSLKTPLLYPIWQRTQQYPHGSWRVNTYGQQGWSGAFSNGAAVSSATLPGEEVKRWMEPHPYIDWDGFSPLTAGAVQLDCLESIDEARKNAMDRGVNLDTYVVIPGADQSVLDRMVEDMRQKHSGSKNHRSFGAFGTPTGDAKATFQTVNARVIDMDFPEGWEQMVKFTLALFGVPASVAGLSAAAGYSEHYAARQQFYDEQRDYLEGLAMFYTKTLAWPWCSYDDEYLIRVKPRPINDHELMEKQHTRQCTQGTITLDESRAKDDLQPYPDKEVGKLLLPAALAKLQQATVPPPQPMAAGPNGKPAPGSTPTGGAVPKPANKMGAGSLPPRPAVAKALDAAASISDPAGGFLVAPAKKKVRRGLRFVKRVLKGME